MAWGDAWPDWQDAGNRVELTMQDGTKIVGVLEFDDFSPGPDEQPYWHVRLDNGSTVSFVDHEEWRFILLDREGEKP